ncbi:MAG: hypothetical protein IT439_08570 [Phycisphaerales bacterium]|nr:hypothetical protein [Phycisphaerales bacterium]
MSASRPAKSASPGPEALAREGLTSIVIAFAMAFVAMGFVVRGFVIPTGSMAPSLLGSHLRLQDPESGFTWALGPYAYRQPNRAGGPLPTQGTAQAPVKVHAPLSGPSPTGGRGLSYVNRRLLGGDRLFALRYLPLIAEPRRFDPVVFAGQSNPDENVIKRLVGLPGEQIALAAGDAFTRTPSTPVQGWAGEGWHVARKPERLQRTLWWPVFDSSFRAPQDVDPWRPEAGWAAAGRTFTHTGALSRVRWEPAAWPITDFLPHNEIPGVSIEGGRFPDPRTPGRMLVEAARPTYGVGDLALSAHVRATGEVVRLGITADGHEFMGEVRAGRARVAMRPESSGAWQTLDEQPFSGSLALSLPSLVELWRVDQAVWLFVGGRLVAGGPEHGGYNWSPLERIRITTGLTPEEVEAHPASLEPKALYSPGFPWIEADGEAEFFRVRVSRDIFWRPVARPHGNGFILAGRATHPSNSPTLGPDQFFLCGDNSTDSEDGRGWGPPHPAIADGLASAGAGVVPREMIIGRAFVVYLPALQWRGMVPILDVGRMRWLP